MPQHLKIALFPFQEELDLDNEQRFHLLRGNISGNHIDLDELKREFNLSMENENFDWVQFAVEINLLISPSSYNQKEVRNFVRLCLADFLFPSDQWDEQKVLHLTESARDILQRYTDNNGWMFSYDLYDMMKRDIPFKELDYFHLWKLDFYSSGIQRKPIENKYQEIGYLKAKLEIV